MKFATNNKKINELKTDCLMISVFDDGELRGAAKLVNNSNGKFIEDFKSDCYLKCLKICGMNVINIHLLIS